MAILSGYKRKNTRDHRSVCLRTSSSFGFKVRKSDEEQTLLDMMETKNLYLLTDGNRVTHRLTHFLLANIRQPSNR